VGRDRRDLFIENEKLTGSVPVGSSSNERPGQRPFGINNLTLVLGDRMVI